MDKAVEQLEGLLDRLKNPRNYRYILAAALIAAGAYLFTGYLVTAALILGVGLVSWTVNQLGMKQLGLELATFSTVLIGVTYGAVPGAVMGFALILLQITAGQYTGDYIIWVIPSYPLAGFLAGLFGGVEIFLLGAVLAVGMQAVFAVLTIITSIGNFSRYFPYAATNVIFNLMLFQYLAPLILPLMT